MIIVAGTLHVDAAGRAAYLDDCAGVVSLARRTAGCRDFALSPDPLDAGRINVFERWDSEEAMLEFRADGPDTGQRDAVLRADVGEYRVDG